MKTNSRDTALSQAIQDYFGGAGLRLSRLPALSKWSSLLPGLPHHLFGLLIRSGYGGAGEDHPDSALLLIDGQIHKCSQLPLGDDPYNQGVAQLSNDL